VYRAIDFIGDQEITRVAETSDTLLVDPHVNTLDTVYNYRIVVYSKPVFAENFIPVDTSAIASSVRLAAESGIETIHLAWRDSVPWSNVVQERPYHLIYRGVGMLKHNELQLYDSVRITAFGFEYTDHNVDESEMYTYRVVTRGTYGNDLLPIVENSSQSVAIYPINNLKPCAPVLSISSLDCDDFVVAANCGQTTYDNDLAWTPVVDAGCRIDVVGYKLYKVAGRDTTLLTATESVSFTHEGLSSPAVCYAVSAIDALGNEGPKSVPSCNDTCPYFNLPNVFTPNADGCNDLFTARYEGHGEETSCAAQTPNGCPRFVKLVTVHIYNRWGTEVFSFHSADAGSVYVDWDGTDKHGRQAASGVYYYTAQIEFETTDESKRHLEIKDWVHLLR
jgi:hypothetical protein